MSVGSHAATSDRHVESPHFDDVQPHDEVATNLRAGILLWAAGTVFVFLPPFFAWFYLQQLNSAGQWKPAGVDPPQGFGLAIVAAFALSAAVLALGVRARTPGLRTALAAGSLALGAGGVALQVVEYTRLPFGASGGGYASVFYGWTAVTAAVALVTMLWLETFVAHGLRNADAPRSIVHPRHVTLAVYWALVACLSVVMWLLLYVLS
jgi:heme/copper-type cytochrome/quinol oxidase subunit 3